MSAAPRALFRGAGGTVTLPDPATTMIDRRDGGQVVIYPARRVWDRTALDATELTQWNFLVAAAAAAMLDGLPQLKGGCINYWDAGNWALHPDAAPAGPKTGVSHRVLHQHLVGRSLHSHDPSWAWGESPFFPPYRDRFAWSAGKAALTAEECHGLMMHLVRALRDRYGVHELAPAPCARCAYPTPASDLDAAGACPPCATAGRS